MATNDSIIELDSLLDRWRREIYGNSSASPVPILTSIAELLENETEIYLKLPIDPFDDRHPSRAYPGCSLGSLLEILFENENFMSELTTSYLTPRNNIELPVVICRLLIDVIPGLDSSVVFIESESLVSQLLDWAERAEFPLNSYATALLASVMKVPGISALHREKNNHLVPIMFHRLHQLTHGLDGVDFNGYIAEPPRMFKKASQIDQNEGSGSFWAEAYTSGSYQMHPLNTVMQQRFILQYLASLGEYQEFLVHIFEHKAISYILQFIDGRKNHDVRLALDSLKFLASCLTHKKFAFEFLDHGGLPQLLRVTCHGMASTGVSLCLCALACNADVMERICLMKGRTAEKMVFYGLGLLECSHDLSRANAALFFSLCFHLPILLKIFDMENGLRKLLNVISMRGLLSDDPRIKELSEDDIYSIRQAAKQASLALERYTREHFISETLRHTTINIFTKDLYSKPRPISDEDFADAIELYRLEENYRFNWQAIDKIVQEGGILYLLKLIAHFLNEGIPSTEKAETVRSALEILVVCSLCPRAQLILLELVIRTNMPHCIDHPALAIIVMCADPKIGDVDCQKSALNVLINLADYVHRFSVPEYILNATTDSQEINRSAIKRELESKNAELAVALGEAIWQHSGTLVLPQLLTLRSPLTEADCIRALTCRVLCGLGKEDGIRQIMSKLPLFRRDQLQSLMKEPVLPERRSEHAIFCEYCRELIDILDGTIVLYEDSFGSPVRYNRNLASRLTSGAYDQEEIDHIVNNILSLMPQPNFYHRRADDKQNKWKWSL